MTDPENDDEPARDEDWNGTPADRLISRIVDRQAEPADWARFVDLARIEPSHWERLLSTLRTDGALRLALGGAFQVADRVETRASVTVLPRWRQWSGWAAAAFLGLAWAGSSAGRLAGLGAEPGPQFSAQVAASDSADPAAPVDAGTPEPPHSQPSGSVASQVALPQSAVSGLDELPLRLVSTRPGPQGRGIEVTYVRPIVERTVVDGVYSVGTDELGRPTPVSVDPKMLAASNDL